MLKFGDFPSSYKKMATSKVAILPIAYDETSTWKKGADKGPLAILEASQALEWFDRETSSEPYKIGIHTYPIQKDFISPKSMVNYIKNKTKKIIDKQQFYIGIGGEHSVSIGAIYAFAEEYKDLSVLQIDAHADLRDKYLGSKYNHACVMRRAREVADIVQVGIRSFDKCEYDTMDKNKVFFAEDIYNSISWIPKVIDKLSDNVFITIDLDGFDPSILPATGTPEPGGLMWYQTLQLLKEVFAKKNVVGCDVVELCPNEYSASSDFFAAKLIYKMIGYKYFL